MIAVKAVDIAAAALSLWVGSKLIQCNDYGRWIGIADVVAGALLILAVVLL